MPFEIPPTPWEPFRCLAKSYSSEDRPRTRYLDPLLGKDLDAAAATTASQTAFRPMCLACFGTKIYEKY